MCFNTTFVTVLCILHFPGSAYMPVSIQLLLLFYSESLKCGSALISFNTTFVTVLCSVSVTGKPNNALFQYNFCYCSMKAKGIYWELFLKFQYNFCYCSILTASSLIDVYTEFQYNFCYCSINPQFTEGKPYTSFNTTFVTVL